VCALADKSLEVAAQGGRLELRTVRIEGGAKTTAAELAAALAVTVGTPLGR
jgi:methionyl-tRNA formyltransferase